MTTTLHHLDQQAIKAARSRAVEMLRSLKMAQAESEQRLCASGQPDHLKRVTGASVFDNTIAATQRIIDTIDRHSAPARAARPEVTIDPRLAQRNRFAGV